jgi:hypothetical protein
MNSSRRDFLLRTGLVSLGGSGLLLSACGGGGGGTGGGTGGGVEGLLNYGSQELPTKAYGIVPAIRSTSGAVTSTSNVTLPGVASILGSKSTVTPGMTVSLSASLDVAKAVSFIATVPAEITSRISYGIDILVSSIQDSGKVHVAIDLPVEMQSKDPNTIVVGAHLIFADSEGFVALESAVSADKRTVAVDVPASVFEEASGKYLAHLVVAEMPVSRRPGTRPVDYSPNAQEVTVASETPSGFSFQSRPLDLPSPQPIEIVSRVGMREATATESYDRKPHVGVDIRADEGTRVLAVADGYLVRLIDFSKQPTGQGNFVSIDHGDVASQYLHLASIDPGILAKIGGRPTGGVFVAGGPRLIPIKAGEVLGIAGSTSTSRIDRHLHLNLVPSGSAWKDSRGLTYVYNPEPLLGGVLDKPQLIAEFLFGFAGKKYQSHDDPNMFIGNPIDELISVIVGSDKTAYLTLHAKDSVFRDVPLPSDGVLSATCSNTNIATVSIDNGRVKIVAKKNGEVKVKVVYTASAQKGVKAYGVVKVNVETSRVAILGTPKPNPDGSQDPPGLYWQSLTSDARQLLVRTTGDHYVVHINPEQTKLLFIAKVVHADRTDTQPHAYVINVDGTGLTHILKEADSWAKFSTACYLAGGIVGACGSPDGGNELSGLYICNDDGSNLHLIKKVPDVTWMTSTPDGKRPWTYGTVKRLPRNDPGWEVGQAWGEWSSLDYQLPNEVPLDWFILYEVYTSNGGSHGKYAYRKDMYDPILCNGLIALCEPVVEHDYGNQSTRTSGYVKYGRRAFWIWKDNIIPKLLWETSEVVGRKSPRFSVFRNGEVVGLMDMQCPRLGMPNPNVLYGYIVETGEVVETKAAQNWSNITNFALPNQTR